MKVLATNRRAKYDYEISERLEAGIVLSGAEVKSVKAGHISLKGSYITLIGGELYLLNAHISPYKYARPKSFEETRRRKLLVHKREADRLSGLKQAGQALFPLAVGTKHSLIKVEVGVGRGRQRTDKRQIIKKRQAEREIARAVAAKNKTQ